MLVPASEGTRELARPGVAFGRVECVRENVVYGWAFDPMASHEALSVELRIGEHVVGSGLASLFDRRLKAAGFGHGRCRFAIPLRVPYLDGRAVDLVLHDARSGEPLQGPRYRLYCVDPRWIETRELGRSSVQGIAPTLGPAVRARAVKVIPAAPTLGQITAPARKRGKRLWKRVRRRAGIRAGIPPLPAFVGSRVSGTVERFPPGWIWPTPEPTDARLSLPKDDEPLVSVILPVHDQYRLTCHCLRSLILSGDETPFEVVLVDDRSTDATRTIETCVDGLVVVRNEENLGFLRSCLRGVDAARGRYLLFLNNDTEVAPGFVDALRDMFSRHQGVGAVGAKLVYPDGRLQDAGGIVWDTGVPWNVGHGDDPDDPRYRYVRDVDYLTGAALMVERAAWESVGGFSPEYAPAYYEDTDLAFKLRAAGFRTLYCPQAVVTHFEGGSHGTCLDSGGKRYQRINAARFVSTWKTRFGDLGAEGRDLHLQKDRGIGFRVLMLDAEFPRLGEDAGSYAAVQEIELLQSLGAKITFLPESLLYIGHHVEALQRRGVECVHAPYVRSVEEFLVARGAEFDVMYVTRYTVAEKILETARRVSRARIILNNADLHFLRELRQAIATDKRDLSAVRRTRQRELAVMNSVDAVMTYSDVEGQIIASHLMRDDHVHTCPWVIPERTSTTPLAERTGLCFLGGFAHSPNLEAVEWFLENVWSDLRSVCPDLTFDIWGSRIPPDADWSSRPGVRVRGYATSLDEVFETARMFVAPLRSGAGIKGKVLDSICYGVPAVLSPVAAEATGLAHGASALIARQTVDWVDQVSRLNTDDVLWHRLRSSLSGLYHERYSFAAGQRAMQAALSSVGVGVPHAVTPARAA